MNLRHTLVEVARISREAGQLILDEQTNGLTITTKSDGTSVSSADMAAHRFIIMELTKRYPSIPAISEEGDLESGERADRYWLIDPLDGTKGFIDNTGTYTVNIALIDKDTPILGVIYNPLDRTTYGAAAGEGFFKQIGDGTPEFLVQQPVDRPYTVIMSPSVISGPLGLFLSDLEAKKGPFDLIKIESSIKFCYLADGRADIYPRLGHTSQWDIAAGHALLLETGKDIYVYDTGKPLLYDRCGGFLNPFFIAA